MEGEGVVCCWLGYSLASLLVPLSCLLTLILMFKSSVPATFSYLFHAIFEKLQLQATLCFCSFFQLQQPLILLYYMKLLLSIKQSKNLKTRRCGVTFGKHTKYRDLKRTGDGVLPCLNQLETWFLDRSYHLDIVIKNKIYVHPIQMDEVMFQTFITNNRRFKLNLSCLLIMTNSKDFIKPLLSCLSFTSCSYWK